MLLDQLLKPFGYLTIRHPYKWIVDWLYPLILAVITLTIITLGENIERTLTDDAFISKTLSFIQSLPGFYIAALAAIATFGRTDIDQIIPAPTPKVRIKDRGVSSLVSLTRRRFLAMLFAFLTGESLLIIMFAIFLLSYGSLSLGFVFLGIDVGTYIGTALVFLYLLMLYQMIVATFWGLYYLGHKLHE